MPTAATTRSKSSDTAPPPPVTFGWAISPRRASRATWFASSTIPIGIGGCRLTNNNPFTGEGIYRAQYLWIMGYQSQALAANQEMEANARRRGHPFDLAFALTLGAQLFDFLGDPEALLRRTEEAERIGKDIWHCTFSARSWSRSAAVWLGSGPGGRPTPPRSSIAASRASC